MSAMEPLVVPVGGAEALALRSGRLPTGERVGIAFSTESRLIEVMGTGQRWIHLSEPAMKSMLAPLGIDRIQVDPGLIAPAVSTGVPLPRGGPDRATVRAGGRGSATASRRAAAACLTSPRLAPLGRRAHE